VEKKGKTLVGFREKYNPRYITDIHTCGVIHAKVDAAIDELRQLLDAFEDKRCIAQIELAAGDDEIALIFRNLSLLSEKNQRQLRAFSIKTQFRVYMQPAGPESVQLLYPSDASEYLTYRLPEFGLAFEFHPTDFTQVNSNINRKMVKRAVDLLNLQPQDCVLDLFCGLGNFSLPIAQYCQRVVGIEGSAEMIKRAQHNAHLNQLTNIEFACANLEEWSLTHPLTRGVTKLLLDPPRCGALGIIKQIQQLNPKRIVYVSCNPVTLARDAEILVSHGYRLDAAGVMDMFPHTSHVESIALFVK
jgi:23S rRNA (uracil1939-C5)-methyltransferase